LVDEVCPVLRHLLPFAPELRLVVARARLITISVCELELDNVGAIARSCNSVDAAARHP